MNKAELTEEAIKTWLNALDNSYEVVLNLGNWHWSWLLIKFIVCLWLDRIKEGNSNAPMGRYSYVFVDIDDNPEFYIIWAIEGWTAVRYVVFYL